MNAKAFSLSNNQLKFIAMIAMLLDHTGKILLPQYIFLSAIGRIAFPIFAFMIAEGCTYTKNRKRYFLTLLCLSVIFQAVYFYITRSLYINILFTFSLSIATIYCIDLFLKKKSLPTALLMLFELCLVVFICFYAKPLFLAHTDFKIDYGYLGVILPVAVYFAPNKLFKIFTAAFVLIIMSITSYNLKWFALFSIPLLCLYNGKRGKLNLKYMFYIFYVSHLIILYTIKQFI